MRSYKLYKVFARDVGRSGYSCVCDMTAYCARDAVARADREWPRWKGRHIAISYDRQHLWPDGKTGRLPRKARKARVR
jgi:hypothetical protein